jgi:hypothetical protein
MHHISRDSLNAKVPGKILNKEMHVIFVLSFFRIFKRFLNVRLFFSRGLEHRRENEGELPPIELPPLKDAAAEGRRRRGGKNKVAPGEGEPESNGNAEQEAAAQPVRPQMLALHHPMLLCNSFACSFCLQVPTEIQNRNCQ